MQTVGDWEPEFALPTLIVQMSKLRPEELHLIVQSSIADGLEPQTSEWACKASFQEQAQAYHTIRLWLTAIAFLPSQLHSQSGSH